VLKFQLIALVYREKKQARTSTFVCTVGLHSNWVCSADTVWDIMRRPIELWIPITHLAKSCVTFLSVQKYFCSVAHDIEHIFIRVGLISFNLLYQETWANKVIDWLNDTFYVSMAICPVTCDTDVAITSLYGALQPTNLRLARLSMVLLMGCSRSTSAKYAASPFGTGPAMEIDGPGSENFISAVI